MVNLFRENILWLLTGQIRYPIITSQPEDMTIDKGSQQLLSVEAEPVDGGNLTYEWYGESVTSGIVSVLKW